MIVQRKMQYNLTCTRFEKMQSRVVESTKVEILGLHLAHGFLLGLDSSAHKPVKRLVGSRPSTSPVFSLSCLTLFWYDNVVDI